MAKQLFRLASANEVATNKSYFSKLSTSITVASSASYSISKARWSTGSGGVPASFATVANGYYNLEINGVLQQSSFYTVGTNSVKLHLSTAFSIPQSAPITLTATSGSPAKVAIP
jgi:hypothetical protein